MNDLGMNGTDPKTEFKVYSKLPLSDVENQYLTALYLPIIGNDAFALIHQLWLMNDKKQHSNFEIMTNLNIDQEALKDATLKLEGTSLIKVYQEHSFIGDTYKYLLNNPLIPARFFNDNLLSLALLEHVGEDQYLQLSNRFIKDNPDFSSLEDTTHDFLDVFSVNSTHISDQPDVIKQVREKSKSFDDDEQAPEIGSNASDFDFNLMLNILKNSFVNILSVKRYKDLFASTHSLYGISEVDMANLVEKSSSLINNRFDPTKFKMLVSRTTRSGQARPAVRPNIADDQSSNISLTSQERQLIQVANTTAPVKFLNSLKLQKHGFTTASEERILSDLSDRGIFNNGVINVLVYHLIVDENHPTINKNLVDTIANDWSQKGITTSEEAIKEIKNRTAAKSKPVKRRRYGKSTIKETLPEWAKDSETESANKKSDSETPLSDVQKDRIARKLKKLNQRKNGE